MDGSRFLADVLPRLQRLEQAMREGNAQAIEDMLTLASETRAHWRMGAQRTSRHK